MELGIGLPTFAPDLTLGQTTDFARRTEADGFACLGTIDRLVYANHERLIALRAAAAVTQRILLATAALLTPYRWRPDDFIIVVVSFHNRREQTSHTNAAAAHHHMHGNTIRPEYPRPELLNSASQFEYMSNFQGTEHPQAVLACRAPLTGPQVRPMHAMRLLELVHEITSVVEPERGIARGERRVCTATAAIGLRHYNCVASPRPHSIGPGVAIL